MPATLEPHRRRPPPTSAAKSCTRPPIPPPGRTTWKGKGNSRLFPAPSAPSPASIPTRFPARTPPWLQPYCLYIRVRHISRRTPAHTALPRDSTPTPAPPPRTPAPPPTPRPPRPVAPAPKVLHQWAYWWVAQPFLAVLLGYSSLRSLRLRSFFPAYRSPTDSVRHSAYLRNSP